MSAKAAGPAKSLLVLQLSLEARLAEAFNDLSEADRKELFDHLRDFLALLEQPARGPCGAGAPPADDADDGLCIYRMAAP